MVKQKEMLSNMNACYIGNLPIVTLKQNECSSQVDEVDNHRVAVTEQSCTIEQAKTRCTAQLQQRYVRE